MEYKDYYKTLQVNKDATQAEIKRAYRKLARQYHPDVSDAPDAEKKFKEVGEAYEVLKDPEKRAAYDQLGADWQSGQDFHPPPNWDAGFEFSGRGFSPGAASPFSDFFESLFGRRGSGGFADSQRAGPFSRNRGEDHHAKVLIDIEDAFHGATRSITLHVPGVDASGHVNTHDRTLNVQIPKGIRQGQQIRLAGQGAPGIGGAGDGDLYLQVEFKSHSFYRIKGQDLYLELPVAPWEVALGATVKVPTPTGVIDLKIPPGSTQGRKLRLKGRGIPGKPAGNFYAVLQVVLPEGSGQKAQEIYRQMQRELAFNPRAKLGV